MCIMTACLSECVYAQVSVMLLSLVCSEIFVLGGKFVHSEESKQGFSDVFFFFVKQKKLHVSINLL